MKKLSKIALFVFNRPVHTFKVLNSLKKNNLAKFSEIYIFSDEVRNKKDKIDVAKVRKIIKNVKGFKKKTIIYRNRNFGLAKNFIDGINEVLKKNERIIVLEDDNLVSPHFLSFMNDALEIYKNSKNVGSISGYSYRLNTEKNETFFSTFIPSWGWATWRRSWKYMKLDGNFLMNKIYKNKKVKNFNLNNSYDFMRILKNQANNINDSWSIRWYASLFLKKKLALFSTQSYVHNIGFDGSGVHTPKTDIFKVNLLGEYKKLEKIPVHPHKEYNYLLNNFFKKLQKREKFLNFINIIKYKINKIFGK